MLLKISGVARLTRDVELRYTQSGSAIASFGVACSEKFKTQAGEQRENTTFVDVTAFARLGEICNQYLKKGSQVYIVGKLKLESWNAQDGSKRSKHSITLESMEMLGKSEGNGQNSTQGHPQHPQQPQQPQQQNANPPVIDIDEESIPF